VEKIGVAPAGTVLGHEVVGQTEDGRRVALVHHLPCGDCARCRTGHETTCLRFPEPTIRPGGLAEWVRADEVLELPDELDDVAATALEPLACVVRGAARVPRGDVLVIGQGFVGVLFAEVLRARGDDVFTLDTDPRRTGRAPARPVSAVVVCAPGAGVEALRWVEPGGTVLLFVDAGTLPTDETYRRELTVVGSRSSTPASMRKALDLLPSLTLPPATVLPLERFADGLALFRRRDAVKVVFTP
jgi:L-iditol 2-dehydrogenase